MTGVHLGAFSTWVELFSGHQLILFIPGFLGGIFLSVFTSKYHHFMVFPGCLILLPLVFFLVLFVSGYNVEHAREFGFLAPDGDTTSLLDVYRLFDFGKIHWGVMFPLQLPTMISMLLVIAFASSLDIAAICMGTGSVMNYNEQLQTVGASNFFSGMTGKQLSSVIYISIIMNSLSFALSLFRSL